VNPALGLLVCNTRVHGCTPCSRPVTAHAASIHVHGPHRACHARRHHHTRTSCAYISTPPHGPLAHRPRLTDLGRHHATLHARLRYTLCSCCATRAFSHHCFPCPALPHTYRTMRASTSMALASKHTRTCTCRPANFALFQQVVVHQRALCSTRPALWAARFKVSSIASPQCSGWGWVWVQGATRCGPFWSARRVRAMNCAAAPRAPAACRDPI
jgi:hypothetical protein